MALTSSRPVMDGGRTTQTAYKPKPKVSAPSNLGNVTPSGTPLTTPGGIQRIPQDEGLTAPSVNVGGGGGYAPIVGVGGTVPTDGAALGAGAVSPGAPGAPAAPGTATVGAANMAAAIDAAIAAIEAQYGLTREQLLSDESEIGRTYRLLVAEQGRNAQQLLEQNTASALDRGILRSGIQAANVADIQRANAEQVAALQSQEAAAVAALRNQQQQAEAARAAEVAAAQQGYAQAQLSAEQIAALAAAGL